MLCVSAVCEEGIIVVQVAMDDFGSVDFKTVAEVEDVLDSWAEEARLAGLVQGETVGELRQGYCTLDDALEERLVAEASAGLDRHSQIGKDFKPFVSTNFITRPFL